MAKDKLGKVKRQKTRWENICSSYYRQKRKSPLNVTRKKKPSNPSFKMHTDRKRVTEKEIHMAIKHTKNTPNLTIRDMQTKTTKIDIFTYHIDKNPEV